MAKRHHHPSDAERAYNRVVWEAEREHERMGRQQGVAAVRRQQQERSWRVAGVALAVAALLAVIGIVVQSFL
jgi:hypothetical protein